MISYHDVSFVIWPQYDVSIKCTLPLYTNRTLKHVPYVLFLAAILHRATPQISLTPANCGNIGREKCIAYVPRL